MNARLRIAGVVLIAMATAGALWWEGRAGQAAEGGMPSFAVRYPFARAPRRDALSSLRQEIAFYQQRIARDPQGGLDLASLATAYLKMARATGQSIWYLRAEQAALRSLANLPDSNDGALLALARVAEARHNFVGAIRLARRASGREDALAVLVTSSLGMGEVAQASELAETLVLRAPTLGAYALRALTQIARGHDGTALRDFRLALAAEEPGETSTSAWLRTLMGRFFFKRGQLDRAEELYREALATLPRYPIALLHLADLEARAGRYADAELHYWQVLAVTPGAAYASVFDHAALQGQARLRVLQGDREGARALWNSAEGLIRSHLSTSGHRRELARLLLERGDPGDAREALSLIRAEVGGRRDAETMETLTWALSRSGRWVEARKAIRAALRLGVRDAAVFYRAGLIEEHLGDERAARQLFALALEVDPTFDAHARAAAGVGP